MSHWHDSMVDRPETDGAVYVMGWTISGLAVLGVILVVWVFGCLGVCDLTRGCWSRLACLLPPGGSHASGALGMR